MDEDVYVNHLKEKADNYINILEDLFGPTRKDYIFQTITRSEYKSPMIYYPLKYDSELHNPINICVSPDVWDGRILPQGAWQVAHECVHLLDPTGRPETNCFEEGLATWFQCEPEYHEEDVKDYILSRILKDNSWGKEYAEARDIVRKYMPELISMIKKFRAKGIKIGGIAPDKLASYFKDEDIYFKDEDIEKFCEKFKY